MFELDGAIDLHVHCGPDVIDRVGDDLDVARAARAAGMAGMAVKSHIESTASRAYLTNRIVDDFRYIGGICLNYPVGGLNAAAVDSCLALGGRLVWMPSSHARFHADLMGELGNWGYKGQRIHTPRGATGITLFGDDGELSDDTKDVVAVVKQHDAIIGTSHLSPEEVVALARYTGTEKVKLLLTHVMWTPTVDIGVARHVIENGGLVEISSSVVGGYSQRMSLDDAARMITDLGPENIVIASDAGGIRHPHPHEALRVLANNLIEKDIDPVALRTMLCGNPARLIES